MRLKLLFLLLLPLLIYGQEKKDNLDKTLKTMNKESVPYISVSETQNLKNKVLLDSREKKEYETSHIKNAVHVGYDTFDMSAVVQNVPNKADTVIVYCSIGVRSEDIGEKLLAAGYTNVYNLYGGIFEWKSEDNTVYNDKDEPTEKIHTYNKFWSRLLKKGTAVYDK